jgi:quercetin dioxygenase-like cupin family protein
MSTHSSSPTRRSVLAASAAAVVGSGMVADVAKAQQVGSKRTDLQRHDLSIPGREVIQVVVELAPGVTAPAHTHPGEEIIYVIEGLWEYQVEGKPPVTLKAGEVLFIPAGMVHSAKNVGSTNGAELATYIVEKGKPLLTLAK